jgi:hypothetical protein
VRPQSSSLPVFRMRCRLLMYELLTKHRCHLCKFICKYPMSAAVLACVLQQSNIRRLLETPHSRRICLSWNLNPAREFNLDTPAVYSSSAHARTRILPDEACFLPSSTFSFPRVLPVGPLCVPPVRESGLPMSSIGPPFEERVFVLRDLPEQFGGKILRTYNCVFAP